MSSLLTLLAAVSLLTGVASMACAETIDLGSGPVRLGLDAQSGSLRSLSLDGREVLAGSSLPDCELGLDAGGWPAEPEWRVVECDTAQGRIVRAAGGWRVTETWTCEAGRPVVSRRVRAEWQGDTPVRVHRLTMRVPGVRIADDAEWCIPGNFPVARGLVADGVPGGARRERGWTGADTGVAWVTSESERLGCVIAYQLDPSHAAAFVETAEGGAVNLTHHFETLALLRPGDALDVGAQWIRLVGTAREGLGEATHDLLRSAVPGPPEPPAWLPGASFYEMHPWGRLEAWNAGDRGDRMPSIEAQLPDLRELGIDAIWLLPVSEKPPWVYHLPTFRTIDPLVTTMEQLRSFVDTGHRLGIRTLMDLVTYGIEPSSPDVANLPSTVWSLDEGGERIRVWGGSVLSADCSDPDWQRHIVDLTSWWVRETGCDGFRLDCGGTGQTLNWALRNGRQADTAIHYGGREQNRLIREAIRAINPEAVLMPEAGANYHFASSDMLFDYPLYMALRDATRRPDSAAWARDLREWLAAQAIILTPEQQRGLVRFLELHDAVPATEYFGVGLSQALTGLLAYLPGALLLQQEQEIGYSETLSSWLHQRHERPELASGAVIFDGIDSSDPEVLVFARALGNAASLVAVNLSPAERATSLTWPANLGGSGALQATLAPYEVRCMALSGTDAEEPRVADGAPEERPLLASREERDLPDGGRQVTLRLEPVESWFVGTAEGLVRDRFLDRHRGTLPGESHADATPPLARCWRPVTYGLWEGLRTASLGVGAKDGRSLTVVVEGVASVGDARIDDHSATGDSVEICLTLAPGSQARIDVREALDPDAAIHAPIEFAEPSLDALAFDPLWVRLAAGGAEYSLARRHGGAIRGIRFVDGTWLGIAEGDVYTDHGFGGDGQYVSLEGEATPRLGLGGDSVSFRGSLRTPSWNGVQSAGPVGPLVASRLSYAPDSEGGLLCELGITPSVDKQGLSGFLAWRLGLTGVDSWSIERGAMVERGKPGDHAGQRVGTTHGADLEGAMVRLQAGGHTLLVDNFGGAPEWPQSVFILDGGPGMTYLYIAMLDGGATDMPAGQERTTRFRLRADP